MPSDKIDFFGYRTQWYAPVIYAFLFAYCLWKFRRNYTHSTALFVSTITIFSLEISWEFPLNFLQASAAGVVVDFWVALRLCSLLAPFYIWVYCTFKFGKPKRLLLLSCGVVADLIAFFYPNYVLSNFIPWSVRLTWALTYLYVMDGYG